jgi:hypothetical protein
LRWPASRQSISAAIGSGISPNNHPPPFSRDWKGYWQRNAV